MMARPLLHDWQRRRKGRLASERPDHHASRHACLLTRRATSSSTTRRRCSRTSRRSRARRRSSRSTPSPSKARSASSTCCRRRACSARASRPRSCSTGPASRSACSAAFPKLGDEAFPGHLNFNKQIDEVHGRGRQGLRLPLRAAGALRPRRAVADRGHPADQPARRARPHPAAPQATTPSSSTPGRCDAVQAGQSAAIERERDGKKASVRAAAVQIAPDLDSRAATLDRVLAAIAEAAGKGARARRLPRDLRPLLPVLLLRPCRRSLSGAEHMRLYEQAVVGARAR